MNRIRELPLKVKVEMALAFLAYSWAVWLLIEGHAKGAFWVALIGSLLALKDGWRLIYHRGRWREEGIDETYFFVLGVGACAVFLLLKAIGVVIGLVPARNPGGTVVFSVLAAGFGLYVPFKYFRMFPPDQVNRQEDENSV